MNLYVHVPFCKKKCNYCAFHSTCPTVIDWDEYTDEIIRQLNQFHIYDYRMNTIFFGGGTPSLMPVKYAEKIISKLNICSSCEWTLEANPKTISSLELKDWKDIGLNRLSVGIQSFDDKELAFLGRIHNAQDAIGLIGAANDLNLRVSGDFIYGLPGQTVSDVIALCEQINNIGLKHASLYELTIEQGTKFQNLSKIDDELGAEMYLAIQKHLNLSRYEISNYGEPCLHNSNVWAGDEYIGVGESAAGRIKIDGKWFETKIINGEIVQSLLTDRERSIEMVMTGLRTMVGVQTSNLPVDVINSDFVVKNPEYFEKDDKFLKMTDSGILILDGLIEKVIS
jgi:oxygen-independent coproporphyrinogen III oxidase